MLIADKIAENAFKFFQKKVNDPNIDKPFRDIDGHNWRIVDLELKEGKNYKKNLLEIVTDNDCVYACRSLDKPGIWNRFPVAHIKNILIVEEEESELFD